MRAELLAIGSELLGPLRRETNTLWLTDRLLDSGVEVVARTTVADDLTLIASALRTALARADLVIATGGLGPTADDVTREASATATGRTLHRDAAILEGLRARFARFGRAMSPTNEKQADVVLGAVALSNARGTAPGQVLEQAGALLVLLPGPPGEMKPMFDEQVRPMIEARIGSGRVVRRRVLRIAAMPESEVDQLAAPVYQCCDNPRTTILGSPGQVELHLVAVGQTEAEAEERTDRLARSLREALPGRIYSEDGRDLPEVVAGLLRERRLSIAVAESCTGGLLSARLTDVPGVSAVFGRGVVAYANRTKTEELGIPETLIEQRGAVSEEVALAMAGSVRRKAAADVGIGVTGIAGPDGGTSEKPVGLVFVAIDGAAGTRVRRNLLPGGRTRVRFQATQVALEMVRRGLLALPPL